MSATEPILGHQSLLYAQVTKPGTSQPYFGFYPSRVHFCTSSKQPVVRVRVTVDDAGDYWAWWEAKTQKPVHIYPKDFMVEMCFTYGTKEEEERGRGKVCRVRVEEVPEDTE